MWYGRAGGGQQVCEDQGYGEQECLDILFCQWDSLPGEVTTSHHLMPSSFSVLLSSG